MGKCSYVIQRRVPAGSSGGINNNKVRCSRSAAHGCNGMCRQHHAIVQRRSDCSVCLASLAAKCGRGRRSKSTIALHCGHAFHTSCIMSWVDQASEQARSAATCPMCRASMGADDYSQIYSGKMQDALYLLFLTDPATQQAAMRNIDQYIMDVFEHHMTGGAPGELLAAEQVLAEEEHPAEEEQQQHLGPEDRAAAAAESAGAAMQP